MLETNSSQGGRILYQMDTPVGEPSATGCPHFEPLSHAASPSFLCTARQVSIHLRQETKAARWSAQSMPRFKPAATENPFRCRRRGTLLPHSPTHLVRLSCVGPLDEAARPQVEPGISLPLTEGRGSLTRPLASSHHCPYCLY